MGPQKSYRTLRCVTEPPVLAARSSSPEVAFRRLHQPFVEGEPVEVETVGDSATVLFQGDIRLGTIDDAVGDMGFTATFAVGIPFFCSNDNIGNPVTGDKVYFDDEAAAAFQTLAGDSPAGSYEPAQPLSAFDGMNMQGNWTLTISDHAGGEVGTFIQWSLHFVLARRGGKTPENEPDCGLPTDTVNGGCNYTPQVFGPISCGESYRGTGAFDAGLGLRDTDWYKLVLAANTRVTWTVMAEFESVVGIVNTYGIDNCDVTSFLTYALGAPCDVVTVSACVPPGTWYLFVAPDFNVPLSCPAKD